jgi:hypothetical protein
MLGKNHKNCLLFEAMYFDCAMNLRGKDVGLEAYLRGHIKEDDEIM